MPSHAELTAGKGIDLTGDLGCHHIDCLSKEIDGLYRHAWHYFDRISLPDQAFFGVTEFQRVGNREGLQERLEPVVLVLERVNRIGGLDLIRFDIRQPSCTEHFSEHAADAHLEHALANTRAFAESLTQTARITWDKQAVDGHFHVAYRLESPMFEHSEWGTLCAHHDKIPEEEGRLRKTIALSVARRYLAALSADALAAHRAKAPLGSSIPFYKRLLGRPAVPTPEDVAFELALPVSNNAPVEALMKVRRDEGDAFLRLQRALRLAIAERLKTVGDSTAEAIALEIRRDVIDPELRAIREKLKKSRRLALRGAGTGVGLGTIAATVGLLAPLGPLGTGLAVGGAITLGAQALKKANDDELAALKEVQMSDLYFLWRGHKHGKRRGTAA